MTGVTTANRNLISTKLTGLSKSHVGKDSDLEIEMDILVSWWEGSCFCLGVGSIPYFPAFHRGGPWERWWVAHSALLIVTLYATPPSSMPSFPPLLWLRTIWKSILFSRSVRLHALAVTTFLQILLRTKVRKGSGSKLDYSKDVWDIPQLLRTKMPLEIMHKKTIEASGRQVITNPLQMMPL